MSLSPQVVCTVGDSCAGPPPLHVSWGSWVQGRVPNRDHLAPDFNPIAVAEMNGTSKSPLPKTNVGFTRAMSRVPPR